MEHLSGSVCKIMGWANGIKLRVSRCGEQVVGVSQRFSGAQRIVTARSRAETQVIVQVIVEHTPTG